MVKKCERGYDRRFAGEVYDFGELEYTAEEIREQLN